MASSNKKATSAVDSTLVRLAGGSGAIAAVQSNSELLRRVVLGACLLWEDVHYESGNSVADQIRKLVPLVEPSEVAKIAIEARRDQKLMHVPLFVVMLMTLHDTHKHLVKDTLKNVILDEDGNPVAKLITEFMAMYMNEPVGMKKHPGRGGIKRHVLSGQVKRAIRDICGTLDGYQMKKWHQETKKIPLRSAVILTRPKPKNNTQSENFKTLIKGGMHSADTWRVHITKKDDVQEWDKSLLRMPAKTLLMNLDNIIKAKVSDDRIREALETAKTTWLLPIDFLKAAEHAPKFRKEISDLMIRGFRNTPKIPGDTILLIDVSGSMWSAIASGSKYGRLDAAYAMAAQAKGICERAHIYLTAGNDNTYVHQTMKLNTSAEGFDLIDEMKSYQKRLGGGGIFTRQAIEWIAVQPEWNNKRADRLFVMTDSQDCDRFDRRIPNPDLIAVHKYIADISSHRNGIKYEDSRWDAEISGWSEHFLKFAMVMEKLNVPSYESVIPSTITQTPIL